MAIETEIRPTEAAQPDNQTPPATPETTAPEASGTKQRSKRSLLGIYVNTPKVLRDVLESEAKEKNTSVAALVRDKLAMQYNLTLPAAPPRTKYATIEEKTAARKAANKNRAELLKLLMAVHKAKKNLNTLRASGAAEDKLTEAQAAVEAAQTAADQAGA